MRLRGRKGSSARQPNALSARDTRPYARLRRPRAVPAVRTEPARAVKGAAAPVHSRAREKTLLAPGLVPCSRTPAEPLAVRVSAQRLAVAYTPAHLAQSRPISPNLAQSPADLQLLSGRRGSEMRRQRRACAARLAPAPCLAPPRRRTRTSRTATCRRRSVACARRARLRKGAWP